MIKKKINGVRRYAAEALLFGDNYDETETEALRLAKDEGMTFVSPYNDAKVMAGAGTIGLEIVAMLPDIERVVVPVAVDLQVGLPRPVGRRRVDVA